MSLNETAERTIGEVEHDATAEDTAPLFTKSDWSELCVEMDYGISHIKPLLGGDTVSGKPEIISTETDTFILIPTSSTTVDVMRSLTKHYAGPSST